MSLPAPDLDDRTFQDIVDEAKRLIPLYCPEWTNHNVSDPGVALIELFAWMSEMVLFRVNQVPERLYIHFLNLVGIEPFPPSVARADLTFWLATVLDTPVTVPAGAQVTTTTGASAGGEAVVFTTVADLVIAPPQLVAAKTATADESRVVDVWEDLRFDPTGVACFPSAELTPGDAFHLGFSESLAGVVLRLDIDARAEGIGVDPRNPPVVWEVWSGEAWIPVPSYEDSTGGLNRAGQVVLLVPLAHEVLTLGNTAAYWLRARLTATRPGQPTYQASPRIRAVTAAALGGTTAAEHAQTAAAEVLGRSDGRPGQHFTVSSSPVLPRTPDEHVLVVSSGPHAESVAWEEVDDFSASGPRDRHYVWESGTGTIRFGPHVRQPDGTVVRHGRSPADGSQVAVTRYRHGGGARGNVGTATLTVLRTTIPYVSGVTNLGPATGGVDAETVAEARVRGPLTLRTGQRAVTSGDFERLALASSVEVARVRCLPTTRGNGSVRLLVVPRVRGDRTGHRLDDFAVSAPLLQVVTEHLDRHRLVGTAIEVSTPYYQGVSVAALVHTSPGRPAGLVRQRAIDALTRYIDPLAGGADGNGWPFDADLNSAVVGQVLESVDGIERVEEALLFEYDLRTGRRLGSARDIVRLDQHSLFLSAAHQVVVR